ncbi:MAG TPA: hypothetical protein VGD80_29090 [Kofleriaceae bacterium]
MKKSRKQLALALEIIRALSPASLAEAMGGAVSEFCNSRRPFCPTSACPPPPAS